MVSLRARNFITVLVSITLVAVFMAGCARSGADQRISVAPKPKQAAMSGIIVDVSGMVRRPGVYELERGSRIIDALNAAGGLRTGADISVINRASLLTDGQQVVVGKRGSEASVPGSGAESSANGAKVSLNKASAQELETIPGIGPVTAERIVTDRTSNGVFTAISDLERISGIGPATIAAVEEAAVL